MKDIEIETHNWTWIPREYGQMQIQQLEIPVSGLEVDRKKDKRNALRYLLVPSKMMKHVAFAATHFVSQKIFHIVCMVAVAKSIPIVLSVVSNTTRQIASHFNVRSVVLIGDLRDLISWMKTAKGSKSRRSKMWNRTSAVRLSDS